MRSASALIQRQRSRLLWKERLRAGLLLLSSLFFLAPMFLTISISLRSRLEVAKNPLAFPTQLHFENYAEVFGRMDYLRAIANTFGITLAVVALVVILAPLAAYPLARVSTRWTAIVYRLFLGGLTIPFVVILVPLYLLMRDLHLINTYTGIVLLYTALNMPFAVFLYTSFISSIPRELEEASVIDGAAPLGTFRYIILPLLRPVSATLAMSVSLSVWNDFLIPLVFLHSPESRPIMVSVYSFLGQYGFDPITLFPAAVLGSLPLLIFFFALQRQIIAGVTAGAVKG